jgi:hypothetical protein
MKKLLIIFASLGLISFAYATGEVVLWVTNNCGRLITIQQSPPGPATGAIRNGRQEIDFGPRPGEFMLDPTHSYTFCHTDTNNCCAIRENEIQTRHLTFTGQDCHCVKG